MDGAQRRTGKALLFACRPGRSPLSNLTVQLERNETARVLNVERDVVQLYIHFGFLMMLAMQ